MIRYGVLVILSAVISLESSDCIPLATHNAGDQIIAVTKKMISALGKVESFSCETDIQYYQNGKTNKRYLFTFIGEKTGRVCIKFLRPYRGVRVIYQKGEKELTIKPFSILPIVKFRLSIDNSLVISPSGQRIDQCTIEYRMKILDDNRQLIQQGDSEYLDKGDTVDCVFWAKDYTKGKELNRYRVVVSKKHWFPMRIERYNQHNIPIEVIIFKNYMINNP